MNTRMKIAVLLAGIAGTLLATATGFAYAQSMTQQPNQTSCGAGRGNMGGMGFTRGMSHVGSMSQDRCRAQMNGSNMGQCQGYAMMLDQNETSPCH